MKAVQGIVGVGKQRGVTFFGVVLWLIIIGFAAFIGMKVVPEYTEYGKVVESIHSILAPGKDKSSVEALRSSFTKQANIGYVTAIKAKDLVIVKEGDRVVISFAYDRRIPLFKNASLLLEFEGKIKE